MGDGGVACMYNVMDRFPVPDNTSAQLKPLKKKKKKKQQQQQQQQLKKPPPSSAPKEPDNPIADEVEEGELGSLAPEIVEAGEFIPGKWRRTDSDFRGGGGGGGGGGHRDEIEKGEFVPDRWPRDDYGYVKMRRSWKWERERTPPPAPAQPPPSGKYSSPSDDGGFRRKEFNRGVKGNANQRWECGPERNVRISSKIVDEEGLLKKDFNNTSRSYGKEHSSGNRLKRFGAETDTTERKHYGDYADFGCPKSRRLSDERLDSGRAEHYSRPSVERSYRTPASRAPLTDKYLGRNYDSALPSRTVYERHARSPVPMERSPRDRNRYYDHRERSPVRRERSPFVRDRSPYGRERSPFVRDRSPYGRERSPPYGRERSPYDRSRPYDHKNRSQSPPDRSRHSDRRDRTPSYLERSPHDWNRPNNHRETGKKSGPSEKRSAQSVNKEQEDKPAESLKEPAVKDSSSSAKESLDKSSVVEISVSEETNVNCEIEKEEAVQSPGTSCKETAEVDVTVVEVQELPSMEEDMDICDTPPHVTVVSDLSTGKWFYLDYYGVECGPSKLCDLKTLMEEGALMTDHMIKHVDSDRWMTVENAASPLVTLNFPSILPDSITRLVNPPEAPGNLLVDKAEFTEEKSALRSDSGEALLEPSEELQIDERVEAMLEGISVVPGKELETVGDVLQMTFECALEWVKSEGLASHPCSISVQDEQMSDEPSTHSDVAEGAESLSGVPSDKDHGAHCDSGDWFSSRWSCKGGDWMRNDEATTQERSTRKKLVLNDGFPLCQMPKSGYEDPRWHRKDDLYYPSQGRRLDLPHWGFSIQDDKSDSSSVSRLSQSKAPVVRGVKGTMLPVVRINTCVVKDHGSFVSESRMKARGKDRHSSRTIRSHSTGSDGKRSSVEGDSQSRITTDCSFQGSWKYGTSINKPRDHICTVDELQLNFGEWYYLDGTGHEQGPSSFSELQTLVDQGIIPRRSSVFRKVDRVWVPITSSVDSSDQTVKCTHEENTAISGDYSASLLQSDGTSDGKPNTVSTVFNNLHPQFIGYTLGKLHELVMKSYKSREFAATINEVLDPWINARQPKKDIEKHIFWKTEGDVRAAKRARFLAEDSEDDNDTEDDERIAQSTFEDLCSEASFCREETLSSESGWGSLDGHMLARVFHFLRADMKSLTFASLTCKHWRATAKFYRDISRQIDFSCFGPECFDSMVLNIANDYKKDKISAMVLRSCINITSSTLEEILFSFPCLSTIDIRGCSQFNELTQKFPSVNWIKNRNLRGALNLEDSHAKVRSLRHITEKSSSVSRVKGPYAGDMDDFGELKQYFDSVNKRDSANQLFRRSLYKRSKLFDARKSSSILSRDARTRRWAFKKSENGYKRMEEFLASSLKDIMKENTFDFFVPKVAEIQDKMKKGYYIGRGLNSVKEDISRMCRDAIKAKKRGDTGNMNRMVTLFIQLASRLEAGSTKFSHEKDVLKLYEDDSSSGFSSTSKYKKKLNKVVTERKYRSNGTSSLNGGLDYGEDASDREIRRRLSKLNKRSFDSESDTSDDADRSFEDSKSVSESTISDTESEKSESQTWQSKVNGDIIPEASLESMTDDREWGARMTKASLVPPVTRKYEVIDRYVVVADEDEVKRKMQVSLPDEYAEKLSAQKNGIEESDMELPEVKDYKPRKQLGSEVLEQEVYGIDPYTHNLLLDSMPEEIDCPLLEKHVFIEEVLLRTLNKKVRNFTGTGNTPMVYPLQPVIEEIQDCAEDDGDFRTVTICQSLLRAIDSRTDDKYVAYRKGLGVVCNKEAGFTEEDFVVEFLGEVYPVWKWFEKQDGIRSLQKNSDDPAPEFYNIYLERPKGDADGYDLLVVDAMHKANYASRICHSCRPNCEAKVTAVDGHYQIGIYSVRKISHGEEITFDYNSVTESKEEYEASVCLCGSQVCRGSYLNLTGEGAFQKVLKDWHGVLDCHQLMLEACETNSVSEEDYLVLGRAGLGNCLLGGLPDWLIAYSAHLVRFINFERTKLPDEILKHNLEEKRKYFSEICLEVETSDAEVQAEGVYNQRLQNLAVTLDKVRYVMRCIFGDPKLAPPPLERMSPEAAVSFLWKGEGSLVEELVECLTPHVDEKLLDDLKSKISAHDPSSSQDIQKELKKSLLWLRDEVQNLPCSSKSRNDAAADLIHIYAYTKSFFRIREYKAVTSPPVYISPLELGPKYKDKLGSSGLQEYCKTYRENYCLGQLIFWHNQTNADPDCSLASASRGCLSLPELCSFYAMIDKPSRQRVYGPKTLRFLLTRMEKVPQKAWPRDRLWSFKSSPKVIGSPMLDAVLGNTPLDKEMVHWLKHRPTIYQAMWDR